MLSSESMLEVRKEKGRCLGDNGEQIVPMTPRQPWWEHHQINNWKKVRPQPSRECSDVSVCECFIDDKSVLGISVLSQWLISREGERKGAPEWPQKGQRAHVSPHFYQPPNQYQQLFKCRFRVFLWVGGVEVETDSHTVAQVGLELWIPTWLSHLSFSSPGTTCMSRHHQLRFWIIGRKTMPT